MLSSIFGALNIDICVFMMKKNILLFCVLLYFFSCSKDDSTPKIEPPDPEVNIPEPGISVNPNFPLSDQNNDGGWVLNTQMSDEFEGEALNQNKWLIQGTNGEFQSNFKGRAPSQFSTKNVRLENGMLKLETRWEPNYDFNPTNDRDGNKYENITTAAIITKNEFKYGYIEVKSKAADAEITSSLWATGNLTELDFFEMFGDHKQPSKQYKEKELWWSIHDWSSAGQGRTTYTEYLDLGYRVAGNFHVYGFEWDETGIKVYVDGNLISSASIAQINAYDDVTNNKGGNGSVANYVVTKPIKIWLDQETFPWHGVPDSLEDLEANSPLGENTDGVVDFEVEYLRVWQ